MPNSFDYHGLRVACPDCGRWLADATRPGCPLCDPVAPEPDPRADHKAEQHRAMLRRERWELLALVAVLTAGTFLAAAWAIDTFGR